MNIAVYQIYFDEKTKNNLEPDFIPYYNEKKNDYFENMVMKDIYEKNIEADYIGISSWKQRSKTQLTGAEILSSIRKDIQEGKGKDVYIYNPTSAVKCDYNNIPEGYYCNGIIKSIDLWTQHNAWGAQVSQMNDLLNKSQILPFDINDGKWLYSHCNYWIAKKSVFNEYCEKILIPTIQFMEREDVKQKTPAWYIHNHDKKKYRSCSFTLEALFGSFLGNSPYSYSYIMKKRIRNRTENINVLRYERIK